MTRLDLSGLRDLWYRIDDIFARLTEAVGSISWSSPTLSWTMASGGGGSSVDLSDGLATEAEAGHSLSISGRTITLKNVNGGTLNSVTVPTQEIPATDFYATSDKSGNVVEIDFYTRNGGYITSVRFNVSDSS